MLTSPSPTLTFFSTLFIARAIFDRCVKQDLHGFIKFTRIKQLQFF